MRFRSLAAIGLLAMCSAPALADDCERAEELKFMIEGKTLAELLSKVGRADHVDYSTIKIGPRWVSEEAHIYFPLCDNQTIFTIRVRGGRIVEQERQIERR